MVVKVQNSQLFIAYHNVLHRWEYYNIVTIMDPVGHSIDQTRREEEALSICNRLILMK